MRNIKVKRYKQKVQKCSSYHKRQFTGDDFYLSPEWKELKKQIIRIYGSICMRCKATNTEMHVDHIVPRSRSHAKQLDPRNLQVLCVFCNKAKSNRTNADYRTKSNLKAIEQATSNNPIIRKYWMRRRKKKDKCPEDRSIRRQRKSIKGGRYGSSKVKVYSKAEIAKINEERRGITL